MSMRETETSPEYEAPHSNRLDYADLQDLEDDRQSDFLNSAIAEAKEANYQGKELKGPHYADFNDILADTTRQLADLSPLIVKESLAPFGYQSDATKKQFESLPHWQRLKIGEIKKDRRERIQQLADDKLAPVLADQTIPDHLLDEPPYSPMHNSISCTNACFRMVFGGITGWIPDGPPTQKAVMDAYGQAKIHDEEYLKIFQTPAFKTESNQAVTTVDFSGADLEMISKFATNLKEKRPEAKIFTMLNLGTETTFENDIWHSNILIGANETDVICHDPIIEKGANRHIPKQDFTRRWATAYNRGHFIIAL